MKQVILAAAMVAMAGQASALSCRFGDAAEAYNQATQNGPEFMAVVGTLDWDTPDTDPNNQNLVMDYEGQAHVIKARFVGDVIGENGARTPIDSAVTIMSECINGDCGYAYKEDAMLSFIHAEPDGLIMYAYPCQSYPTGVSPDSIEQVQDCVDGGACEGTWPFH